MNTETPTPRLVPDRPSDALLPRPFCGSSDLTIFNDGVWCEGCGAHHDADDKDGAITLWNRRAAALPAEAPGEREWVESLAQRWDKQAEECEAESKRLGTVPVAWELARDAAQYRQCAYQLRHFAAPAAPAEDGHLDMALRIAEAKAPRVTGGREELRHVDHPDCNHCYSLMADKQGAE